MRAGDWRILGTPRGQVSIQGTSRRRLVSLPVRDCRGVGAQRQRRKQALVGRHPTRA